MKILFCCAHELRKELGGPKIMIELAEELTRLGWLCDLVSRADTYSRSGVSPDPPYSQALHAFLKQVAADYDVVEIEHNALPFPRHTLPAKPLLVARATLLVHHFLSISLPWMLDPKDIFNRITGRHLSRRSFINQVAEANATLAGCDLINLANYDDQAELLRHGFDPMKMIVVPFGISRTRRPLFETVTAAPPIHPRVAFLGTFDVRKGATDLPAIFRSLADAVPGVSFRMLGTAGQYQSKEDVLRRFPEALRGRIEVLPTFPSEQITDYLKDCTVGLFPSYIESFGFGVLEMMASCLPVAAYRCPGPPMMLPDDWMVVPGDRRGMARLLSRWLTLPQSELSDLRLRARELSRTFSWESAARITAEQYEKHAAQRRKDSTA